MSAFLVIHFFLIDSDLLLLSPETPKTAAKRKAEAKKETPPAKKAKAEGEGGNDSGRGEGMLFLQLRCNALTLCFIRVFTVCRKLERQQRL